MLPTSSLYGKLSSVCGVCTVVLVPGISVRPLYLLSSGFCTYWLMELNYVCLRVLEYPMETRGPETKGLHQKGGAHCGTLDPSAELAGLP